MQSVNSFSWENKCNNKIKCGKKRIDGKEVWFG